jgi:hypothetical protein
LAFRFFFFFFAYFPGPEYISSISILIKILNNLTVQKTKQPYLTVIVIVIVIIIVIVIVMFFFWLFNTFDHL